MADDKINVSPPAGQPAPETAPVVSSPHAGGFGGGGGWGGTGKFVPKPEDVEAERKAAEASAAEG